MRVLGDIFGLRGFFTWHLVMTILMCAVWLILFCLTVWAFAKGKIFMAKPEDVIHDSLERKALSPSPSSAPSGRSSFATTRVQSPIYGAPAPDEGQGARDKEARGQGTMGHEQV